MSGIGTALSAAVNGFVDGRNVRHSWQDRKEDQARRKRLDEIRDAQEGRAAERHGLDMTTGGLLNDARQRELQKWDQDWTDWQDTRGAMTAADEAAAAGMIAPAMGASPDMVPEAASVTEGSTATLPPAAVSSKSPLSYGRAAAPVAAAAPAAPVRADAAPSLGATPDASAPEVSAQQAPPAPAQQAASPTPAPAAEPDALFTAAPGGKVYARAPRSQQERDQIVAAAKEGRLAVTPEREAAQARLDRENAPDAPPMPNPNHEFGGAGGIGADLREVDRRAARGIAGVREGVQNTGIDILNTITAPGRAVRRWMHGENPEDKPRERVDLNFNGSTGNLISPVLDAVRPSEDKDQAAAALKAETAKGKTPAEAEVAQGAAETLDAIGNDPAMQAAAESLPVEALGAKPGQVMNPERRQKAAKTYLESYRENGAPIVMRELMRQGRFSEAETFDTFMRSQEAQEGMQKWGEGMFAALSGDAEGVFDYLSEAYNAPGYYEDGYSLVRNESELIRDENGQPVGIKMTLQHGATGQKFTQTGRVNDIMQHFLWKLSPQEAFKAYNENQQAMQKALLESQIKRDETERKLISDQLGWDNRAALETLKGSAGLDGKMSMSWPEAQAAAMGASPLDDLEEGEHPVVAHRPR